MVHTKDSISLKSTQFHRSSFAIETHWNVKCKFGGVGFCMEMLIVRFYLFSKNLLILD